MIIEPISNEGIVCLQSETNWRGCLHIYSQEIKNYLTEEQINNILEEAGAATAERWLLEYEEIVSASGL